MEPVLQDLLEAAAVGADGVSEALESGGDWSPMLLLSGGGTLTIVALPMQLFENDRTKDALAYGVFPYLSHRVGAEALCLLSSTWIRTQEREHPKPLEELERREALVLVAASKTQMAMQVGEIIRDAEGVPRLEWQDPTTSDDVQVFDGRFPDALREALDPDPEQWKGIELDLEELDL